jgi:hypothetical protein
MQVHSRLVCAGLAVAMLLGAIGFASAQTPPGTLTRARDITATRISPTRAVLRAQLESTDGCHHVRFEAAPPAIVPPIFLAQRYRFRSGMCTEIVKWQAGSVTFPAPHGARTVTVNATNGTFHVTIR